jgi:hypothetical protein
MFQYHLLTGSNTCVMGQSTCRLLGPKMSNVLFLVAWPSTVDPSVATAY